MSRSKLSGTESSLQRGLSGCGVGCGWARAGEVRLGKVQWAHVGSWGPELAGTAAGSQAGAGRRRPASRLTIGAHAAHAAFGSRGAVWIPGAFGPMREARG